MKFHGRLNKFSICAALHTILITSLVFCAVSLKAQEGLDEPLDFLDDSQSPSTGGGGTPDDMGLLEDELESSSGGGLELEGPPAESVTKEVQPPSGQPNSTVEQNANTGTSDLDNLEVNESSQKPQEAIANEKKEEKPQEPEQQVVEPVVKQEPLEPAPPIVEPQVQPPVQVAEPIQMPTYVNEDPDFDYENKLHEIYVKYNSQPTDEDQWQDLVGTKNVYSYKVKEKDTLWDVSRTFFADPFYWPKIWSMNVNEIGNPHEIEVSQVIRFVPGSVDQSPIFDLSNEDDKASENSVKYAQKESTQTITTNTKTRVLTLPPAKTVPILKQIPDSIPLYGRNFDKVPVINFDIKEKVYNHKYANISLGAFVTNNEIQSNGKVEETEGGYKTAGLNDFIIVSVDDPSAKRFQIINKKGKLEISDQKTSLPFLYEVQGEIEILNKVNENQNVFRAKVTKAISPIDVGALVVMGKIEMFNPKAGKIVETPQAKLIGMHGGALESTIMLSEGLVFFNGGQSQGFSVGQTIPVYHSIQLRNPKTLAKINNRMVGKIKIVHLSDTYGTGFLTDLSDYVEIGDPVGGGVEMQLKADQLDTDLEETKSAKLQTEDDPEGTRSGTTDKINPDDETDIDKAVDDLEL